MGRIMTKYSLETAMTTSEKVKFIREFLSDNYSNLDNASFTNGWWQLLDLYINNNLSHEFRLEMEKEINSIYDMVLESEFSKKKEKRIPALHVKGILLRTTNMNNVIRVNNLSGDGFTDYEITHYDVEVMILDPTAEFVQNFQGNFLDYTEEATKDSQYVL